MSYKYLKHHITQISHLFSAISLLEWDQHTNMPPKSAPARSGITETLTELALECLLADDTGRLIQGANEEGWGGDKQVYIDLVEKEYLRKKRVPKRIQVKMKREASEALETWKKAKEENDFALFAPSLNKLTDLMKEQTEHLGYEDERYDAMLDLYEPGLKSKELDRIIKPLESFLIDFIGELKEKKEPLDCVPEGIYSLHDQQRMNEEILRQMGYRFDSGHLTTSSHPFSITINHGDSRLTTRYNEKTPFYTLLPTMHEGGHGLYEQGIPEKFYTFPDENSASMGIHEGQSRFWENCIGRSEAFWDYFHPQLVKFFPAFKDTTAQQVWRSLNRIKPSAIRVQADELTYNFHIILRFQLERGLINGDIKVEELPELWKEKMQHFLGLTPKNDGEGILQDIHWSMGYCGYFPTYMLGNLYSAQLLQGMKKDVPTLEDCISKGQFNVPLEWMREKIHCHGRRYEPQELIKKATGEKLNSLHFIDYVKEKYSKIYL